MTWLSGLAPHLKHFVETQQALGFSYRSQIESLHSFDRFCFQHFPSSTTITRQMALSWLERKTPTEKTGTTNARISVLRQFAIYLHMRDSECFVPDKSFRLKKNQYVCRILTCVEIEKFWGVLKQENFSRSSRAPYQIETCKEFFKLLYCTGIRPSEAIRLNTADFDWGTNTISIKESKGHANRTIALTADLAHQLAKYDRLLPLNRLPFFSFDGSTRPSIDSYSYWLKKIWRKSGLTTPCIRLHDFRHTFITKRILIWHKQKVDLRKQLPYLMSFVGHKRLEDTLYYFRLVPELCGLLEINSEFDLVPNVGDAQ